MTKDHKPVRKYLGAPAYAWLILVTALFITVIIHSLASALMHGRGQDDFARIVNAGAARADLSSLAAQSLKKSGGSLKGENVGREADKSVHYRGVSFNYNDSLASEVKAQTEPASVLEYESDVAEGAAPEHIVFNFAGPYSSEHESSFFSPRIAIYPVSAYKHALSKSRHYVRLFEDDVRALQNLLSEQPSLVEERMPFVPFGMDASQAFHARIKYINFRGGRGVMFLTQYNQEPSLVNNEGLTYTFQGLTNDAAYYVSATFPVTADGLPEGYDDKSTEDYTLTPPRSFRGQEYEVFEKNYKDYLLHVKNRLESLPPEEFQPNLLLIENLIQSLSVKVN